MRPSTVCVVLGQEHTHDAPDIPPASSHPERYPRVIPLSGTAATPHPPLTPPRGEGHLSGATTRFAHVLRRSGLRPGKKPSEGTLAELGRRAASRDAPGRQYHAGGSGQAGSAPKRRVQFHAPWGGYRACGGQSAWI